MESLARVLMKALRSIPAARVARLRWDFALDNFRVASLNRTRRADRNQMPVMKHGTIISKAESLQILKNDLRKAALEKHAAELASATAEERQKLLAQIDRDVEKDMRRRMRPVEPDSLIY